jgi:hypothetical protein
VDSLCHPGFPTTNLSYRFPIFETSATALCGTTGKTLYVWIPNVEKTSDIQAGFEFQSQQISL